MSTSSSSSFPYAAAPPSPSTTRTHKNSLAQSLSSIGLGYAIAVALGFLVLSTILLASYLCFRSDAHRRRRTTTGLQPSTDNAVYLPRIIFVAEDDVSQDDAVGLDPAVINSYPKFVFSKRAGNDSSCSICLCEYKDSEMLRLLPDCNHYFHVVCVDAWLKLNASCPVCRNSPLPTPQSTPLSEVVPLSLYSDGRRQSSRTV